MWHAYLPYDLNMFVMTASAYLEPKDEAHDFASMRHAFLEQQDRQAFLTGNSPLTKDLTLKELYNIQSRLAQEKARETTYQQRSAKIF
jgi:hypothetical protein